MRLDFGWALHMVPSGSFMSPPPTPRLAGVRGRAATGPLGRLALDAGRSGGYPTACHERPGGEHVGRNRGTVAGTVTVTVTETETVAVTVTVRVAASMVLMTGEGHGDQRQGPATRNGARVSLSRPNDGTAGR